LRPFGPNAATDVTGFGLLGHAYEMCERSGVRMRLDADRLPALAGALAASDAGLRTAGAVRNREFAGPHVNLDGVEPRVVDLAYDPQTAGGLLISLPAEHGLVLEAAFAARGLFLTRVGEIEEGEGVALA
jgi:selenide,water dikinase